MTRRLFTRFADGSIWDIPNRQTLRWDDRPLMGGSDPFQPWKSRSLAVMGLPEEIDAAWPELLTFAFVGHMRVDKFVDFWWDNGIVEVRWNENYFCENAIRHGQLPQRHETLDMDLKRVWLRGVRDPQVLCTACLSREERRGNVGQPTERIGW